MKKEKLHLKFIKFNFLLVFFIFYILVPVTLAQDFRNDYQVEYFLSESENRLKTKVNFNVKITNFRSDLYVKQFSIGFPKSFTVRDLKVSDDRGSLTPQVDLTQEFTKITLEFSSPNTGKNSVNNLNLEFNQENLFSVNGNVWEVIIPTIENKKQGDYKIIVHLPENSDKKISISKPKPDTVSGNTVIWNNPSTKTVYAVFGDTQYYKTELAYRIKNNKLVPVYTDIAFPPDTLWQKIYLDKISPPPDKILVDEDSNYLGRYYLNPTEAKTILFTGTIAVFSKLRQDMVSQIRNKFLSQKKYLLAEPKFWKISEKNLTADIPLNIEDVYNFVTNKLKYDYNKIKAGNKRLGADEVLKNPEKAVCMEFTDLFIAIARSKGIYSREIEGYGFSQDPQLRPLSLVSDILHSWPEYYDVQSDFWVPVDPTWENTSGIDYFSSFDLNHIAFVIHGKDPEYPLPAGTYKIQDSRDISITATNIIPSERLSFKLNHSSFPKQINDSQTYQAKIELTNTGNAYYWGKNIPVDSANLQVDPASLYLSPLAPYEKKVFILSFKAKEKNKKSSGSLSILFPDGQSVQTKLNIIPFYYELVLKISLSLFVILVLISLTIFVRKPFARIS